MSKKTSPNKTIVELATEYMQEYYCTFTDLGENHPKTKTNFACWQLFKDVVKDIRHRKDTQESKAVKKPLIPRLVAVVLNFLKKFRRK